MNYKLQFLPEALREWKKVNSTIQEQFKKKLEERLKNPHVPNSRLSGADNLYKIKLRSSGYRLAYEVQDEKIVVLVLAVGKRDKGDIYKKMLRRI
jgi:mRNA interferase RelE/StbE